MDTFAKYRDALAAIPPPGVGGGCHTRLLAVANYGVRAGLPDAAIAADLRRAIPRGRREVPESDIVSTVRRARVDFAAGHRGRPRSPAIAAPPPLDGARYRDCLIGRYQGATEGDLWEASPIRIDWPSGVGDALALLDNLYLPDDILYLGDTYGKQVRSAAEWRQEIGAGLAVPWPHILPNPLDGAPHATSIGNESYRGDAAVRAFRFVVVEFDNLDKASQVAFWYAVVRDQLMPVATIIDSGGKSLHAWLRVNLPDRQAWDRIVRHELYGPEGRFTRLGADRACCNPARLSRLPGHRRESTGQWQRLLYLSPRQG